MKSNKLLIGACLSVGLGMGVNAQIINSTQPDLGLAGPQDHTGLAVAPGSDIQAAVYDDGSGDYFIDWIESSSSSIVDNDHNSGENPDVAYYVDESALFVGYQNGGDIYVDEYYLAAFPNYNLGLTQYISSGQDVNVDMNSSGIGVLTWEDGGDIFACTYQLGGSVGPIVHIDGGFQPDIAVFDDNDLVAITYIDGGGNLMIETMGHPDLSGGNHVPYNNWSYAPIDVYEFPRIASDHNANFGSPNNFSVVVQDYNTFGSASVDAFFVTGGTSMNGPVVVNPDFAFCGGDYPLPVVAYQRGRVRIAWSQYYQGGCAGLWETSPNNPDDILVKIFNSTGTTSSNYREVNNHQSTYASISRTSIASEYDGAYLVTISNYHAGVLFSDQGDLIWKAVTFANPSYIDEQGITEERGNNFSLVTSPVDQTIEILSESDDLASFQLLDNAGRIVELKTLSNEGNMYRIDISHLSGGMYFLNCSSAAGNEVLRILQVTQ